MAAGIAALALAGCTPTQYAATFGPQPAPCTDSVAARVARLPTESVTVADREHALWAQEECRVALAAQVDSARRFGEAAPGPAHSGGRASAPATWPPPPCVDSVAARVARMPADSVSPADSAHAAAARLMCERALAAPPPPASNPASGNQGGVWIIGAALVAVMMLFL